MTFAANKNSNKRTLFLAFFNIATHIHPLTYVRMYVDFAKFNNMEFEFWHHFNSVQIKLQHPLAMS